MRAQRDARRHEQDSPSSAAQHASAAGARQLAPAAPLGVRRGRGAGARRGAAWPARAAGALGAPASAAPADGLLAAERIRVLVVAALCAAATRRERGHQAAARTRVRGKRASREGRARASASVQPPHDPRRYRRRPYRRRRRRPERRGAPGDPENGTPVGLAAATICANLVAVAFTVVFTAFWHGRLRLAGRDPQPQRIFSSPARRCRWPPHARGPSAPRPRRRTRRDARRWTPPHHDRARGDHRRVDAPARVACAGR